MTKPVHAPYHTTNWKDYNAALKGLLSNPTSSTLVPVGR